METNNFGKIIYFKRKELGLTQKELADKLFVSNKTISKWERGNGLPDASMLPLISKELNTSIDILLGKENNNISDLFFSINPQKDKFILSRKKYRYIYITISMFALFISLVFMNFSIINNFYLFMLITTIFTGSYPFIFAKPYLPSYYDKYKISFFSNGFFRINFIGISLNNKNWIPILKSIELWAIVLISTAPIFLFFSYSFNFQFLQVIYTILFFSIVLIIYIVGKKNEGEN